MNRIGMSLIAISPALELDDLRTQKQLRTIVQNAMGKPGSSVTSASGRTAALAINFCERNGLAYSVQAVTICEGGNHRYYVKREEPFHFKEKPDDHQAARPAKAARARRKSSRQNPRSVGS